MRLSISDDDIVFNAAPLTFDPSVAEVTTLTPLYDHTNYTMNSILPADLHGVVLRCHFADSS